VVLRRPAAKDVLLHPFFWSGEQRLSCLLKASDRVEHEDRVPDSVVLPALEAIGPDVFGASWETKLDSKLLDDGRRYRKYNFSSVRDLLRIIRNKSHHFMELPPDMQVLGLACDTKT
jgi:serine/threonine-protein kinase/endoribonuclease IRE1